MYLLYESLYGELLCECESTYIIGLYDSKEKAIERAKESIKEDTENNEFVLDECHSDFKDCNYVRLFWRRQENWGCYYEMFIKEMELE